MSLLKRTAAIAALTVAYGSAVLIAKVLPRARRGGGLDQQTILAIGTFHNPNWFSSHIEPLLACGVKEVMLVADGHIAGRPNLRLLQPPPWATRLLTRAGAKFVFAFWFSLRYRPSLYMGYAIFPAAFTALVLARLFRRPACFQLTSGPLELEGGGFHAENRLLSSLGTPSRWVERCAHALTRQFDLLVVRGSRASSYARELGYAHQLETITGSITIPAALVPPQSRPFDLIFVGRLTERKRPKRFLELVELVAQRVPNVRALMVGDGPEHGQLAEWLDSHGMSNSVTLLGLRQDVDDLVARSKLFVLTSRWEGVSIAMLEAMAAGAVPIANDVGDLADVVASDVNGYLVTDDDVKAAAAHAAALLLDPQKLASMSARAHATATALCSRAAVADRWRGCMTTLFAADAPSAPLRYEDD